MRSRAPRSHSGSAPRSCSSIRPTPHSAYRIAMGAELSRGYHDRTRVFGIMQAVEALGMLAAAGVLVFLEAPTIRVASRCLQLSYGMAVFAVVLIVIAALRLRERAEFAQARGSNPWKSFGDVLRNPHSRV